jgi:hypothetical protein
LRDEEDRITDDAAKTEQARAWGVFSSRGVDAAVLVASA